MSRENPKNGEADPTHVGPPDLILQEIIAPSDVPNDLRERFEASAENRPATVLPTADGGMRGTFVPSAADRARWADVTFAGRALAVVEGTNQPDYDGYGDPLVWVFALRADPPVIGEQVFSDGGFASSSIRIRYAEGKPTRSGERVSFFESIRTEPRNT